MENRIKELQEVALEILEIYKSSEEYLIQEYSHYPEDALADLEYEYNQFKSRIKGE